MTQRPPRSSQTKYRTSPTTTSAATRPATIRRLRGTRPRSAGNAAVRTAGGRQRHPVQSRALAQVGGVDAARGQQRPQLAESRGLDLTDPLAAVVEPAADRLQRLRLVTVQPEPAAEDRSLVRCKVVE